MARLVLTDTSPLIGLARINGLEWLRDLFGRVEMTTAVFLELSRAGGPERAILQAIEEGWLVRRKSDPEDPQRPPHLGAGEWSTLITARVHKGPVLILMDDRLARREAQDRDLTVAGTAAVVGMARSRGLIPSARSAFEALLRADFRISRELIQEILDREEG